jgi:hypothetical protein
MAWGQVAAAVAGTLLANQQAKKSAAKQMAFQKDMSNTSYQRTVKDMRAAGINPILAYKMGGASTPGGASYQPANIGSAGAKAYLESAQFDQVKSATRVAEAQADMAEQDAMFAKKYGVNPNSSAAQFILKAAGNSAAVLKSGMDTVHHFIDGKKTVNGKEVDYGFLNHRKIKQSDAERNLYRFLRKYDPRFKEK